jgi:ureidoglycolate hydrolase
MILNGKIMKLLKAKRLNDTNFKKYGWALRKPDRKVDIENDQLAYWDKSIDLSNFAGNGLLGFLEVKRIPIELKKMNMLPESIRVYISIDAKPSVQFVALNNLKTNKPDMDTIQAFILEEGDSVAIEAGVWHWTPFALTEKVKFAMGLRNDILLENKGSYTVDESKVKYSDLDEPIGLTRSV